MQQQTKAFIVTGLAALMAGLFAGFIIDGFSGREGPPRGKKRLPKPKYWTTSDIDDMFWREGDIDPYQSPHGVDEENFEEDTGDFEEYLEKKKQERPSYPAIDQARSFGRDTYQKAADLPWGEYGDRAGTVAKKAYQKAADLPWGEYGDRAGTVAKKAYQKAADLPWDEYGDRAGTVAKKAYQKAADLPWDEYGDKAIKVSKKAYRKAAALPWDEYGRKVQKAGEKAYDVGSDAYSEIASLPWEEYVSSFERSGGKAYDAASRGLESGMKQLSTSLDPLAKEASDAVYGVEAPTKRQPNFIPYRKGDTVINPVLQAAQEYPYSKKAKPPGRDWFNEPPRKMSDGYRPADTTPPKTYKKNRRRG
jgi:hypothetical protein